MTEAIIFSYAFDNQGGGTALKGEQISETLHDEALGWVHMDANHPDTRPWLEKEVGYLDLYIIDALLAEETRPRMVQIGDGVLLILRGVNLNEHAEPEDMVSIRLWVDPHRIISLRKRKLLAIRDIEAQLLEGKGPKDAGQFVCMLSARMFERMEPVLAELDDTTDEIEERILEETNGQLRESIVHVRKQAIIFRRYIAPQREAIGQLRMADLTWLNEGHKRHLQEVYNHVTRYVEDLDAVRERAQVIKDELANSMADKLNRNMYVLSVIAAIFLPLGFLTGLLGINVGGIPGADNADAFVIFSEILLALVIAQVALFKWLKWF